MTRIKKSLFHHSLGNLVNPIKGGLFFALVLVLAAGSIQADETYRLNVQNPGTMEIIIEGMPQTAKLYLGGAPIFDLDFTLQGDSFYNFTPKGGRTFIIRTEKDGAVENGYMYFKEGTEGRFASVSAVSSGMVKRFTLSNIGEIELFINKTQGIARLYFMGNLLFSMNAGPGDEMSVVLHQASTVQSAVAMPANTLAGVGTVLQKISYNPMRSGLFLDSGARWSKTTEKASSTAASATGTKSTAMTAGASGRTFPDVFTVKITPKKVIKFTCPFKLNPYSHLFIYDQMTDMYIGILPFLQFRTGADGNTLSRWKFVLSPTSCNNGGLTLWLDMKKGQESTYIPQKKGSRIWFSPVYNIEKRKTKELGQDAVYYDFELQGTQQNIKIKFNRKKTTADVLLGGILFARLKVSFHENDRSAITLNSDGVNPVRFNIDLNSESMYFLWKDDDKIVREELAWANIVK
ncbi:MAG: hypothetical protein JRJ85_15140 [Deltaproteobacteria bacterium]|nr:hypothetical protein [Deltaproteobacteria bacterium]